MPFLEKHIIHKVTVEVFTHSMESAEFLQGNLNVFLEEEVFPFVEKHLERYEDQLAAESLQFELVSLNIDVDNITTNQWDKAFFLHLLSKQLDKTLREVFSTSEKGAVRKNSFFKHFDTTRPKSGVKLLQEDESGPDYRWIRIDEKEFLTFTYFLDHGEFPWWGAPKPKLRKLDAKLLEGWNKLPGFQQLLLTCLSSYRVRERLFLQYTPEEITRVISYMPIRAFKSRDVFNSSAAYLRNISLAEARMMAWLLLELSLNEEGENEIYNSISRISPVLFRSSFHNETVGKHLDGFGKILRRFISVKQRKNLDPLLQRIKKSIQFNEFPNEHVAVSESEKEITGNQPNFSPNYSIPETSEKPVEGKVLANAGIILLHPFLGSFFTDCGVLTKDNYFSDPNLAVHLLHYAATGEIEAPDFDLQFEKMLVGLATERPLDRFVTISQKHKSKVEELVKSLLENWPKLKNTSADTVRLEFLQRSGKIQKEGNTIRIIMDRKVQDILLDGLPFNLGMVKLPWRKELIVVEW